MQPDERAIIDYLKGWPQIFVSARAIARRACGRSRFEDDRGWAVPVLTQLLEKGHIETDNLGSYRLVRKEEEKRFKRHVSPHILKILKDSGKTFEGIVIDEDEVD